jgi:hypothetical protein
MKNNEVISIRGVRGAGQEAQKKLQSLRSALYLHYAKDTPENTTQKNCA